MVDDNAFAELDRQLDGEIHCDHVDRLAYSTDASPYQVLPRAVARPRNAADVRACVAFCQAHDLPLIPRAGGTSLAGQVVGDGLVLDVSRHLTAIHDLDADGLRAEVDPGVIQDVLNRAGATHGCEFGPDTSTSNRAMIGGMIGNNACGARSPVHGTTREHLLRADVVLADGTPCVFEDLDDDALTAKRTGNGLEATIYRELDTILRTEAATIRAAAPDEAVTRRNSGYALDALLACHPYTPGGPPFNLCRLLCGAEGTLAVVTRATVRLVRKPRVRMLLAAHHRDVITSCHATLAALAHHPSAIELMDDRILDAAAQQEAGRRCMGWVEGRPGAISAIEFQGDDEAAVRTAAEACAEDLRARALVNACPLITGSEQAAVWGLRKAGLGLLNGVPGDTKGAPGIEDAAIPVNRLPAYVEAMQDLLARHQARAIYYAHASVGLLHLRPELDLKKTEDRHRWQTILEETADLVHHFGGSISGEHGDGRLRATLLARSLGPDMVALLGRVKAAFDPTGIFNPGKIVDPPPLLSDLRATAGAAASTPDIHGLRLDWSAKLGFVRAVERCNGVGECRKPAGFGPMCPSYQASGEERDSTRARANVLRQLVLSEHGGDTAWTAPELWQVLDRCLGCKACASDCPSSVDVGRFKAEALAQRYDREGVPWRTRLIGSFRSQAALASWTPRLSSFMANTTLAKRVLGIHPQRSIPPFADRPFCRDATPSGPTDGLPVLLFVDAFVDYQEPHIAAAAQRLLAAAGCRVTPVCGLDDGRTWLSQGLLDDARRVLERSVQTLDSLGEDCLIVGLEPSAILGFVDEAPDLLGGDELRAIARRVGARARLFESFIIGERERFAALPWRTADGISAHVHGHCHQKAVVGMDDLLACLSLVPDLAVHAIPSACCGMAGAFGYQERHYELSMAIGETVLFPAVRAAAAQDLIVAPGTSCRHQIRDGTATRALHPAEVLERYLTDR